MKFINADPGEGVYTFLNRVLNSAFNTTITFEATHNNITIVVYPQSCIHDLCDKYDISKRLDSSKR
jgi:hypothetical protein